MEHVLIIENDSEQMKKLVAALEGEYRISTSKTQHVKRKLNRQLRGFRFAF